MTAAEVRRRAMECYRFARTEGDGIDEARLHAERYAERLRRTGCTGEADCSLPMWRHLTGCLRLDPHRR